MTMQPALESDPIEGDLVPLSLIAAEIGEPADRLAHHFGEDVVTDDIGLRAIPAAVARQFFTDRAEWKARHEEESERRRAKRRPAVAAGVPAQEGMTAFESLVAADDDYTTVGDEFGRPTPNFLEEELAAGQRALAEKRRQAERRKGRR